VGDAAVLEERLGPALGRPPRLRHVLARVDDQPVEPGGERRLAAELADPAHELHERLLCGVARIFGIAQHVQGNPLDTRGMPLTEHSQCVGVAVSGTSHEDGVGEPLVDERSVGPHVVAGSTRRRRRRLHGRTLKRMLLEPAIVLPRLRGSFGREYHWAAEAATTQRMLPADAAHGAVALAERQTEGRGRLGRTWADSGLMFSVALYPAQPVARWPEITLVAARALVDAIGGSATIKHPNDVLVDGRKAAGILAEAGERVVLGIGVNVGGTSWPGSGWVDGDRLDLLVDVLERLERGYDTWLHTLSEA
jgi:Biotin/lipoate A/B protein ligase family